MPSKKPSLVKMKENRVIRDSSYKAPKILQKKQRMRALGGFDSSRKRVGTDGDMRLGHNLAQPQLEIKYNNNWYIIPMHSKLEPRFQVESMYFWTNDSTVSTTSNYHLPFNNRSGVTSLNITSGFTEENIIIADADIEMSEIAFTPRATKSSGQIEISVWEHSGQSGEALTNLTYYDRVGYHQATLAFLADTTQAFKLDGTIRKGRLYTVEIEPPTTDFFDDMLITLTMKKFYKGL